MKKKLILILFGLGLVFSMGFMPAYSAQNAGVMNYPLLKPTSSALVELSVTNQTNSQASVWLRGTQNQLYYSVYLPSGPGVTRSIKMKPGTYRINIGVASGECREMGKVMNITKKTRLTITCNGLK